MRSTFLFRLLLDPVASTEGNGTGQGDDKPKAGDDAATKGQGDAGKGYEVALKKHENDHAAMARTLHAENERLRAERDEARSKAPGDGAVVLNKADAGRWAELGKLGSVDEIKAKLTAGEDATKGLVKVEREKLIGRAASAIGYDADVLASLAGTDLQIEVKEETRAGKVTRTAEVVTKGKNDKGEEVEERTALDKHAEANWAKFLPSLKAGASAGPRVGGGTPSRTTQARTPAAGVSEAAQPPRKRLSF